MSEVTAKFDESTKQWSVGHDHSPELGKLAGALAKAQLQMKPAKKDSVNPHFKNSYADFASVREASVPVLAANGIATVQRVSSTKEGVTVSTMLIHAESGEWIQDSCFVPVSKQDAQGFGSAISYAKRYSLSAITGIAADEDDDGNAATGKPAAPIQKSAPAKPQAPAQESQADKIRKALGELAENWDAERWAKVKQATLKLKDTERDDDLTEKYNTVRKIAEIKVA